MKPAKRGPGQLETTLPTSGEPAGDGGDREDEYEGALAGDRKADRRLTMTNGAGGIVDASRCGLNLDPRMPFDTWKALGGRIKVRSDPSSWWMGDWLVFGQQQFGERHQEAVELTGLNAQTLARLAAVALRFTSSRRRENLSFQHHADVCDMPDSAQDQWLSLAARNGWAKGELRLRIRDAARTLPGRQEGQPVRVGLRVAADRERRWRETAARSGSRFEDWIAGVLDKASD